MEIRKTYICGHRNPDVDSVAAAFALADLRRQTGAQNVESICAGALPARAAWVFDHFGVPAPKSRGDIYVRVSDLVSSQVPVLESDMPLAEALKMLEASGESSLPVLSETGAYAGMLTPIKLLSAFIDHLEEGGDNLNAQTPVGKVPLGTSTPVLQAGDRAHDVRGLVLSSSHNHFPVLDGDAFVGTVLKGAFASVPPYRMILVDHNETAQGIPGLEEIPVVEVVDHHRIAIRPTADPIKVTADVVGSTCTIVSRMFRGAGLRPSRTTAGVLLAGIVADTLHFQSPTTTETDRSMATWLEKICGQSAESLMQGLLSVASALSSLSPAEALASDRKTYSENGYRFALCQLEESNLSSFHHAVPSLTEALDAILKAEGLDFAALLVTDPVRGNSELLFRGSEAVRRALPYRRENGLFLLPGVLSRKKQLLPQVLSALTSV